MKCNNKLVTEAEVIHLKAGDIVVCRDVLTAEQLCHSSLDLPFPLPIIIAPSGIDKLERSDLLAALAVIDSVQAITSDNNWEGFDA